MFEIVGGVLKITKGDSATIEVNLTDAGGNEYEMSTGDTLKMTVRKTPTSSVLMQVESTSNVIDLKPANTNNLTPGTCCYDIQLTTAAGDVYTVVGLTDRGTVNMVVYSEVTY